jgi:hypothetical protein
VLRSLVQLQPGHAGFDGGVEVFRANADHLVHLAQIDGDAAAHCGRALRATCRRQNGTTGTLNRSLIFRIALTLPCVRKAHDVGRGRRGYDSPRL